MAHIFKPKIYKNGKAVREGKFYWAKIYADGKGERFSTKQTSRRKAEIIAFKQEEKLLNNQFDLPTKQRKRKHK